MTDIWRLGVAELGTAFRTQQLDPVAVLDTCLGRIARLDPQVNSIVTLDAAGAHRAAEARAQRWVDGAPLSPIDGVPLTMGSPRP